MKVVTEPSQAKCYSKLLESDKEYCSPGGSL